MGAAQALAGRLPDDPRGDRGHVCRSCSLGRGEDPAFTFRTMVVAAAWPGATVDETLQQVTERLERTLQETDYLDRVRSYTIAGQTTIFVDLKQSTPPAAVPDVWYQVRKNIGDMRGTLPQGVVGPVLQRRLRQHLRHHLRLHRRRLQLPRTARLRRSERARGCCTCRTSRRSRCSARRTSRSTSSSRPSAWRDCAWTWAPSSRRCRRRTSCARPAPSRASRSACSCASPAPSIPRPTSRRSTSSSGDRIFRLGDIATVRRGFVDPPQPMFRVNGQPAIGLAIAMRDAGDILALGENVRKRDGRHQGQPAGRHRARCWWPTRPSPWTSRSTTS